MQSRIPSQSFVWGVLAARFDSELTLQKSEIWRLSGLLEEYGGVADNDFYREREQKALIDELTGLLVQAVTKEATSRQFTNNSGRRAGRPPDVITPDLAPALLLVFLRCHDRVGRKSVATSSDGELKQKEAGQLFEFINAAIQPLNQYLTTELHRKPLSALRLARFALAESRRIAEEIARDIKRRELRALGKKSPSPNFLNKLSHIAL
jgi:hypothetical protein